MKLIFMFGLVILWRGLAPLVVPFFLLFAKETDVKTTHHDQPEVPRYRLPKCVRWAETPDEHLPGGLYEPTVMDIYKRRGWFKCSWYWLALRNVGSGIVWGEGKEVPKKLKYMTDAEKLQFGVWEKSIGFWRIRLHYGWEVTRDWHSTKTEMGYWATPKLTLRKAE